MSNYDGDPGIVNPSIDTYDIIDNYYYYLSRDEGSMGKLLNMHGSFLNTTNNSTTKCTMLYLKVKQR